MVTSNKKKGGNSQESHDSLRLADENMVASRNYQKNTETHNDSNYFFKSIKNTTPGKGLNHEITDSSASIPNRNGALVVGRF